MFPVPKSDLFICICFQSFFLFPDGCIFVSFWFHLINFWILVCWKYKPMRNKQKKLMNWKQSWNIEKETKKWRVERGKLRSGPAAPVQWRHISREWQCYFAGTLNFDSNWEEIKDLPHFSPSFLSAVPVCVSVCVSVCQCVHRCVCLCVSVCNGLDRVVYFHLCARLPSFVFRFEVICIEICAVVAPLRCVWRHGDAIGRWLNHVTSAWLFVRGF